MCEERNVFEGDWEEIVYEDGEVLRKCEVVEIERGKSYNRC